MKKILLFVLILAIESINAQKIIDLPTSRLENEFKEVEEAGGDYEYYGYTQPRDVFSLRSDIMNYVTTNDQGKVFTANIGITDSNRSSILSLKGKCQILAEYCKIEENEDLMPLYSENGNRTGNEGIMTFPKETYLRRNSNGFRILCEEFPYSIIKNTENNNLYLVSRDFLLESENKIHREFINYLKVNKINARFDGRSNYTINATNFHIEDREIEPNWYKNHNIIYDIDKRINEIKSLVLAKNSSIKNLSKYLSIYNSKGELMSNTEMNVWRNLVNELRPLYNKAIGPVVGDFYPQDKLDLTNDTYLNLRPFIRNIEKSCNVLGLEY